MIAEQALWVSSTPRYTRPARMLFSVPWCVTRGTVEKVRIS